jgi:hypothetical protein
MVGRGGPMPVVFRRITSAYHRQYRGHNYPLFCPSQGYLAHKKTPPPRTQQQAYAQGPMVVLGGGRLLMNEVPLCHVNVFPPVT